MRAGRVPDCIGDRAAGGARTTACPWFAKLGVGVIVAFTVKGLLSTCLIVLAACAATGIF